MRSAWGLTSAKAVAPFRILFIGDFSGPTKFYGALEYEGLETAAAYWNARGGIDGHRIELSKSDDAGNESFAVSNLLDYVSTHPKPNWVYAGTLSNELSALIPVLKRENIFGGGLGDTSNICANAPKYCPTAFFEGPTEQQDAAASAGYMEAHRFKRVGLLAESNADTQSETTLIAKDLKADGIPSDTETFPATAVSVTPEMDALKSDGDDAVFAATIVPRLASPPTAGSD